MPCLVINHTSYVFAWGYANDVYLGPVLPKLRRGAK